MTFRSASFQKGFLLFTHRNVLSQPRLVMEGFWSHVSLCSTHHAQARRKQAGEAGMDQAHPLWWPGCCCFPTQVCSGSSNQTPTKCRCMSQVVLSSHQFEPKSFTLRSFKQEAVFSAEEGSNQINKDLQVSSSSAIPLLVCSLCIIESPKEEAKEIKKERERTQARRSALWDRQDKLKRGIFTVTRQTQGGERGSPVLRPVNYLPTDFLRNL